MNGLDDLRGKGRRFDVNRFVIDNNNVQVGRFVERFSRTSIFTCRARPWRRCSAPSHIWSAKNLRRAGVT